MLPKNRSHDRIPRLIGFQKSLRALLSFVQIVVVRFNGLYAQALSLIFLVFLVKSGGLLQRFRMCETNFLCLVARLGPRKVEALLALGHRS
jgi:hypothetical protein